ncbi:MAG: MauE/DoxX family redox-associated membrane protein [Ignavibacteriaceae bacterium]
MNNKILNNRYLLLASRLLLGFVFIYASVTKISDPESFSQAIYNYKLLPLFLVNILAIILPWIELSAGVLLIFGISVKENSAILNGLLIIFIIAIVISLFRGLDINCGCFGTVDGSKVGLTKILENIGLLILGFLLMKFDSNLFSLLNKTKN